MPENLFHGLSSRALSQTSQASGVSDALSTASERKVISQKSKKKPDPVDVALENNGLCRKLIPRDGNTIFGTGRLPAWRHAMKAHATCV